MKTKNIWRNVCAMILALLMTATVTATPVLTQTVYADGDDEGATVEINEKNFPDENFRKYVSEYIDKDIKDNKLSIKEINDVTSIRPGQYGIKDFTGIEYFYNLNIFDCSGNPVTNLDLSNNTKLTDLTCCQTSLTSLDLSKNTALENINCFNNMSLTSLDLSNNTALTNLTCSTTSIASLDLSKNTNLTFLDCANTSLTRLDLSQEHALTHLECGGNRLESLDLSQCTDLATLNCKNTPLTGLDLSRNINLKNLNCSGDQLTSLDLSNNTSLRNLDCSSNQLTSLNLSRNTSLGELDCSKNKLTSLDLSENTSLYKLICTENLLTSLDLSNNTNLRTLYCNKNQLTSLDLSNNTSLQDEDLREPTYFDSQSRSVTADYIDGKLVVDLADDLGLDMTRVSDVVVTGGTYIDGKVTFDVPVESGAKITYKYDTNNTNISAKMDVTIPLAMCKVRFDTNGGSSVDMQKVMIGDKVTKPADPTKPGYTFGGWYTDKACTTAFDFSSPVTEDMTLYARWKTTGTTTDPVIPPSDDKDTTVTPDHPKGEDTVTKKPILNLKVRSAGSKAEKLVWTKVKDADGYDIYFAKCGSRLKKIKSTKATTLKKACLKKGTIYKYKVRAYTMKDGKKVYIASSLSSHAVAGGYSKKYTDAKRITAAKKSLTLEAGKKGRVKASQTKLKKGRRFLKTSHAALLRCRSTDKSVATVSRSGKVTAKKAGTCRIYIYAQNGMWTSTKITVK
jgi:uncharacterized repeat protein (TIGR02543 family)